MKINFFDSFKMLCLLTERPAEGQTMHLLYVNVHSRQLYKADISEQDMDSIKKNPFQVVHGFHTVFPIVLLALNNFGIYDNFTIIKLLLIIIIMLMLVTMWFYLSNYLMIKKSNVVEIKTEEEFPFPRALQFKVFALGIKIKCRIIFTGILICILTFVLHEVSLIPTDIFVIVTTASLGFSYEALLQRADFAWKLINRDFPEMMIDFKSIKVGGKNEK